VAELGPSVTQLAPDIQRVVTRGFSFIGWDVHENKAVKKTPPTAQQVLTMFETTLIELRKKPAPIMPTPAELANIALACNKLWELDEARLEPGKDYEINLQYVAAPPTTNH
jgi:hypothetical protein